MHARMSNIKLHTLMPRPAYSGTHALRAPVLFGVVLDFAVGVEKMISSFLELFVD